MNLKDFIRSIPDYPKKGILFRDITTLIKNEKAFDYILLGFFMGLGFLSKYLFLYLILGIKFLFIYLIIKKKLSPSIFY